MPESRLKQSLLATENCQTQLSSDRSGRLSSRVMIRIRQRQFFVFGALFLTVLSKPAANLLLNLGVNRALPDGNDSAHGLFPGLISENHR